VFEPACVPAQRAYECGAVLCPSQIHASVPVRGEHCGALSSAARSRSGSVRSPQGQEQARRNDDYCRVHSIAAKKLFRSGRAGDVFAHRSASE
ncbi:MAG: hypothetical protein IKX48_05525, partial [Victivallales bacterium]|nr:hypothetical protein [Victivallales bacterium]